MKLLKVRWIILQEKLVSLRMYNRLTQQDMADLIGTDKRTYVNKEHGVTQFKANEMFLIAQNLEKVLKKFLPTNFMKHEVLEMDGAVNGTNCIG